MKKNYKILDQWESDFQKNIIEVRNLTISFKQTEGGFNKTVIRNVNLDFKRGEVLAIVGESGSGKSVITTAMMGLLGENAVIDNGTIVVDGIEVSKFSERNWLKNKIRGRIVTSVFQNPMTTLTPTMKVGKQIMESAIINGKAKNKKEAYAQAIEILTKFRMPNPDQIMKMYPHQLSGGMKQRIVIACVMVAKPKIIILDEPTTALDPIVQLEILHLIQEIQRTNDVSIIFITHDLGVVASIADRIAIMYAGKVVEFGKNQEVLWNSKHPYTWGLLLSMPDVNLSDELYSIPGSVPNSLNLIKGDAFATRNIYAMEIDLDEEPPFFQISKTHYVASWLYDEKTPKFDLPPIIEARQAKYLSENKVKNE